MPKVYDQAPDEVRDRCVALIRKYHPDLEKVALRLDLLCASTDSEDAHAVTLGGYPCLAVVRIVSAKDRAKDVGDAEITIDRDAYEAMTSEQRDALLDHELYHLNIVRDRAGQPKRDDHGRPKLKMRKHDFNVGWFHEIARRHGAASIEVQQATEFVHENGQLYFGFSQELSDKIVVRSQTAHAIRKIRPDGAESVTVTVPSAGVGFKVDADGIHKIGKGAEVPQADHVAEAVNIADAEGHVSRSRLQRGLGIAYNAACAVIDAMVAAKIVAEDAAAPGRFVRLQPSTASAAAA